MPDLSAVPVKHNFVPALLTTRRPRIVAPSSPNIWTMVSDTANTAYDDILAPQRSLRCENKPPRTLDTQLHLFDGHSSSFKEVWPQKVHYCGYYDNLSLEQWRSGSLSAVEGCPRTGSLLSAFVRSHELAGVAEVSGNAQVTATHGVAEDVNGCTPISWSSGTVGINLTPAPTPTLCSTSVDSVVGEEYEVLSDDYERRNNDHGGAAPGRDIIFQAHNDSEMAGICLYEDFRLFDDQDHGHNEVNASLADIKPGRRNTSLRMPRRPAQTFCCPDCSRHFPRLEHLKRHYRSVHSHEKPFQCSICTKRFSRADNLRQHSRIHERSNLGR